MRVMLAITLALLMSMGQARAASDGQAEPQYKNKALDTAMGQAQSALDAGKYEAALGHLATAAAEDDRNADVHNLTGYALRKLGRYDAAGAAYDKALALDPEHTGALEYQGELFLKLGEIDKARANLEKLDDICWLGCESYYLLRDAIAAQTATN